MQMRAARAAPRKAGPSEIADDNAAWTPLGPAPLASDASGFGQQDYNWVSGRATAVAVDAADVSGNTVYLGGAYGGVWKSSNAGPLSPDPGSVQWNPITADRETLAVGAIAIQPQLSNPDPSKSVILVGTGETNSSGDSYYGLGILRSADGGQTWAPVISRSADDPPRPFAGLGFSKIAFSTVAPQLVVASAAAASEGVLENLENPASVNRGLYYSTDGGVNWKYASVKDANVTIDPGSATAVVYNAVAGRFYAAMRYHGFYSSADGINWTRLTTQPGSGLTPQACPASPASGNCPIYRGELAVVPGRNEMYVWYVDANETDQGIYRSTDGGSNWATISTAGIHSCGDSFGCGTAQGIYNLELAAVPNGGVTDLYAGAINLYKCTITGSQPNCTGSGSNTFVNLTHVYGCSAIAKVHPDQHALDFKVVNGKDLMYFANDGGVYRALDGFTGLTTGTCGTSNQFDSLNQTLGSMTQFVSFSQHPTDANRILGGTQDNGSPATASSQGSTQWLNVNAGDGGYNLINPHDTDEWFTANTDVSIQRCTLGINCHTQDFPIVVQPGNVGSDHGAFYTPYILDPLVETSELIVGTCRVWRGPGTGGTFTQLSINFETGSPTGACTGVETNMVRALAAGGPAGEDGFSKVIYAGTDGLGPQLPTAPAGGHVWVSTNAAGGVFTWLDRTGAINPQHFPVSSVAADPSDPLGLTAYVTIMGFGVSHVWKTTNGGSSWTDFTGNLPDVPANAIVVDPGGSPDAGTVYVGTDVGVFSSPTAVVGWIEVGPTPDSELPGYLPNVAVTALRIFDIGTTKLLRASTYGRGIWQFPLVATPDFGFSISNATQTVFPGQVAMVNGDLIAFNSYDSSVALSCTAGNTPPPNTCDLDPTDVTPTPSGAGFTLAASGAVGDYQFNVHGVGSDPDAVTHDAPITLHVVDFGLTAPSPAATNANRPNNSDPVTFQATASGSFNGTVTLSCSGLPAGATCNFSPSNAVTPTANVPVNLTLIITTSADTPTGTFPLLIVANTVGAPAAKTQDLSLTVTAFPDYTLALDAVPPTSPANQQVAVSGTLTAFNEYSNSVALACVNRNTPPPSTCAISPANLTPTNSGTPFTLTLASSTAGSFAFGLRATGADPDKKTHDKAVAITFFDFQMANQSGTQTVSPGGTATYTLAFSPQGVSTFQDTVTYSCTIGLPPGSTCSFSPSQIGAGQAATNVTLSIQTSAQASLLRRPGQNVVLYAFWLLLPGLVACTLATTGGTKQRRARFYSVLGLLLLLAAVMPSCGGGGGEESGGGIGQPATQAGTFTITVEATSGPLAHSEPVTLVMQ